MSQKHRPKRREWWGVPISFCTVAGFVMVLRFAGFLQLLEWAAYDRFMRWRPLEPIDDRIVVVAISESDVQTVGDWPMSDAVLAQLLEKVKQQQPRAIGLDLYRDLPVGRGYTALEEVMQSTPNLIGVEKVAGDAFGTSVNPPPALSQDRVGIVDLVVDLDGKVRRAFLSIRPARDNRTRLGLGVKLALMYLEEEGIEPEELDADRGQLGLGQTIFTPFRSNDGGYVRAHLGGYQILLNFRGTQNRFQTISMTDVLNDRIPPNFMTDRIVAIGPTAESLNDLFFTPYDNARGSLRDRMPGVIIHANIVSQILSAALEGRALIQVWNDAVEGLWIFWWSAIGAVLSWTLRSRSAFNRRVSPPWTVGTLLVAGGSLIGLTYSAFLLGWWIPVIPPLLALLGSAAIVTGYVAIVERQDEQLVMSLFERHVTAKIARAIWHDRHQLVTHGQLLGRKMTATVLFSDIKNFTPISEKTDPETLMLWLNEYMDAMAGVVLDNDGVVDKFIGDAVMAVFGVPIPRTDPEDIARDAVAAVSCAIEMGKKLRSLNQQWKERGLPTISMRVGIATGPVVAGSLGTFRRLDYTIIGDTVNVAARLESYDKSIEGDLCRILIGGATYRHLQDRFPTQSIGTVQLKGRQQPVDIYKVSFSELQN